MQTHTYATAGWHTRETLLENYWAWHANSGQKIPWNITTPIGQWLSKQRKNWQGGWIDHGWIAYWWHKGGAPTMPRKDQHFSNTRPPDSSTRHSYFILTFHCLFVIAPQFPLCFWRQACHMSGRGRLFKDIRFFLDPPSNTPSNLTSMRSSRRSARANEPDHVANVVSALTADEMASS